VLFSLVYGIVSLMYNLDIGRCICRYTQSIVSGMNDSNTLKAMRSRGIGTEETDRLKNAKDGSAWDFPEN
jgi:hypothetical protein